MSSIAEIPEKERTKITFELKSPTNVAIMREGVQIARMWSQFEDGMTPYPHNKESYCLNSVQVCGFDKMDGPWSCGPFEGRSDVVMHFFPLDDDWYRKMGEKYAEYVKEFFRVRELSIPVDGVSGVEFKYADIERNTKIDVRNLRSFREWLQTGGGLK